MKFLPHLQIILEPCNIPENICVFLPDKEFQRQPGRIRFQSHHIKIHIFINAIQSEPFTAHGSLPCILEKLCKHSFCLFRFHLVRLPKQNIHQQIFAGFSGVHGPENHGHIINEHFVTVAAQQIIQSLRIFIHGCLRNVAVIRLFISIRILRRIIKSHKNTSRRQPAVYSFDFVVNPRDGRLFSRNGILGNVAVFFFCLFVLIPLLPFLFKFLFFMQKTFRMPR